MFERSGEVDTALIYFQRALDKGSSVHKNYHCYGKSLYQKAMALQDKTIARATLEKAKRMLERSISVGGEDKRPQVQNDLFLIDEALRGLT
jgi:hypothetical protein